MYRYFPSSRCDGWRNSNSFIPSKILCILTKCALLIIILLCGGCHNRRLVPVKIILSGSTVDSSHENQTFPYQNFRLPTNAWPIKYHLEVEPDWNNLSTDGAVEYYRGQVDISVLIKESTDSIVLNAKDLTIDHAILNQIDQFNRSLPIDIQSISYDSDRLEMIYLSLGVRVERDDVLLLSLYFSSRIGLARLGFYRSLYTNSNGEKSYQLSTQLSPNHARRAFPCFDEPIFKASFQISITRPIHLKSLSNMPLLNTEPVSLAGNGENDLRNHSTLVKDTFEPTLVMSTYIVAFIIHDFPSISATTNSDTKVSVYAPSELLDQAQFTLRTAVKCLEFYEDYLGIYYPLPKLDIIGIPDFYFGAMENWGLITFRLSYLLYKPNVTSNGFKQSISILLAHEIAHQWFGNLVTMEWWKDVWLKEGLATYFSYLSLDTIRPEWKVSDQLPHIQTLRVMAYDGRVGTHPISNNVDNPDEIQAMFDPVSYSKGAKLIGTLDGTVMDRSVFRKGIQNYLNTYAYQNCDSKDLWQSLQNALDYDKNQSKSLLPYVNLEKYMSSWVNEKGFPLVSISDPFKITDSDIFGSSITLTTSQAMFGSRFVGNNEIEWPGIYEDENASNAHWRIPLWVKYGDRSDSKETAIDTLWLTNQSGSYSIHARDLGSLWIMGNHKYAGYYLVQYGIYLWNSLASKLKEDVSILEPIDRAQLIDNVRLLQDFGYIPAVNALEFITYVNPKAFVKEDGTIRDKLSERDPIPIICLLDFLEHLNDMLANLNSETNENWKKFVTKLLLDDLLPDYDWTLHLSHLGSLVQSRLIKLAITLNHGPTVSTARSYFKRWLVASIDNESSLGERPSPDLTLTIIIAGITYGTKGDWDNTWNKYLSSTIPSERENILYSLGRARDLNVLSRLLELTIDGSDYVKPQDMIIIFSAIASNPTPGSRDLAWNFMRDRWDVLRVRSGDNARSLNELVNGVCSTFASGKHLSEFRNFVDLHLTKVPKRSIAQTLESITINIGWVRKNGLILGNWLRSLNG